MSETPKLARNVTQIAATSNPFGDGSVTEVLYALCDDGTVWRYPAIGALDSADPPAWRQIPQVPQTTKGDT